MHGAYMDVRHSLPLAPRCLFFIGRFDHACPPVEKGGLPGDTSRPRPPLTAAGLVVELNHSPRFLDDELAQDLFNLRKTIGHLLTHDVVLPQEFRIHAFEQATASLD